MTIGPALWGILPPGLAGGTGRSFLKPAEDDAIWHVPDVPRSQRKFGYQGISGRALDGPE